MLIGHALIIQYALSYIMHKGHGASLWGYIHTHTYSRGLLTFHITLETEKTRCYGHGVGEEEEEEMVIFSSSYPVLYSQTGCIS